MNEIMTALLALIVLILWRRVTRLENALREIESEVFESEETVPEGATTTVTVGAPVRSGEMVVMKPDGRAYPAAGAAGAIPIGLVVVGSDDPPEAA